MQMIGKVCVRSVGELMREGYLMVGDGPWNPEIKAHPRFWFLVSSEEYAVSWHDDTASYTPSGDLIVKSRDRYMISIGLELSDVPDGIRPPVRPVKEIVATKKK